MQKSVLIGTIVTIIIIILAIIIYLCINRDGEDIMENNIETNGRLAIAVRDNYISPEGGINIEEAKELLIQHRIANGLRGDIQNNTQIKEITIQEAWENLGIQLYSVSNHAGTNSVMVISNGQIVGILRETTLFETDNSIFLVDLNNDGIYKVATISNEGSGISRKYIQVLDVKNNRLYTLGRAGAHHHTLGIIDVTGELGVYRLQDYEYVLLGRLAIVDGELVIVEPIE